MNAPLAARVGVVSCVHLRSLQRDWRDALAACFSSQSAISWGFRPLPPCAHAVRSTRISISLRSVPKSIGLVSSALASAGAYSDPWEAQRHEGPWPTPR